MSKSSLLNWDVQFRPEWLAEPTMILKFLTWSAFHHANNGKAASDEEFKLFEAQAQLDALRHFLPTFCADIQLCQSSDKVDPELAGLISALTLYTSDAFGYALFVCGCKPEVRDDLLLFVVDSVMHAAGYHLPLRHYNLEATFRRKLHRQLTYQIDSRSTYCLSDVLISSYEWNWIATI